MIQMIIVTPGNMSGEEIIKNLKQIQELLKSDCPEMANLRIGYLIVLLQIFS